MCEAKGSQGLVRGCDALAMILNKNLRRRGTVLLELVHRTIECREAAGMAVEMEGAEGGGRKREAGV